MDPDRRWSLAPRPRAPPSAAWLRGAALLYGAAGSIPWPSNQVLVLGWTVEHQRRSAFLCQFISVNLAIAVGGVVGGAIVDLGSTSGTRPISDLAAVVELVSAAIVWGRRPRNPASAASS